MKKTMALLLASQTVLADVSVQNGNEYLQDFAHYVVEKSLHYLEQTTQNDEELYILVDGRDLRWCLDSPSLNYVLGAYALEKDKLEEVIMLKHYHTELPRNAGIRLCVSDISGNFTRRLFGVGEGEEVDYIDFIPTESETVFRYLIGLSPDLLE